MTATIRFASDHPFGHENIRRYEPAMRGRFASTDESNDRIVDLHNEVVGPDDTVYVLGDLAMGDFARSTGWAARLNGRKRLIVGNVGVDANDLRPTSEAEVVSWLARLSE